MLGIVLGSLIGLLLGNRLPERTQETVMHGLGIITLAIGFQMALRTQNILIVLFAVLIGSVVGEAMRLDDRLNGVAHRIETTVGQRFTGAPGPGSISRGFVASSLMFCVGPIAILGPIQDGLLRDPGLLFLKSGLDFMASIALSAGLGVGVLISSLSVLLYQGGITAAAYLLGHWSGGPPPADAPAIVELTASGGVIIIGLGLNILEIKKIRVANMLPAIFVAPLLVAVAALIAAIRLSP